MILSKQLKDWLVKNANVPATITDDTIFQRAAADAMFVVDEGESGHLSQSLLAELTSDDRAARVRTAASRASAPTAKPGSRFWTSIGARACRAVSWTMQWPVRF